MTFPAPVINVAIEPKTKSDQEKLGIRSGPAGRRIASGASWVGGRLCVAGGRNLT